MKYNKNLYKRQLLCGVRTYIGTDTRNDDDGDMTTNYKPTDDVDDNDDNMNHTSITIVLKLHRYPTKICISIIIIIINIFVNKTYNKDGDKQLFWMLT